jgi:hypothetical protein
MGVTYVAVACVCRHETPIELAPLLSMLITLIARNFSRSVQTNVWISFVAIYQNVADLIVSLSIRRCPSKFINVAMCEQLDFWT